MNYSTFQLGAIGADLAVVVCFFAQPWRTLSANLTPGSQAWLLNEAGFSLRALGRLTEAVKSMRAGLEFCVAQEYWNLAVNTAYNLSESELILGDMAAALAAGKQSVDLATLTPDLFLRYASRASYADALHQSGRRDEALRFFCEAEDWATELDPRYPRLGALGGFQYCDLLLAEVERAVWRITMQRVNLAKRFHPAEKQPASGPLSDADRTRLRTLCEQVTQRAKQTLAWGEQNEAPRLLGIGLDTLSLARTALYAALLDPSSSVFPSCNSAVDGLRRASTLHHVPRGLLTRAWARWLNGDETGCWADLDEAWEIAEPGRMRLHMADILLSRARLFHSEEDLQNARHLIERCGHLRRKEELEDAEVAAKTW